jgi:hypothetical protein
MMSRDEARHAGFINKAMSDFNLALDLGFLTKNRTYTFFKPKVRPTTLALFCGHDACCTFTWSWGFLHNQIWEVTAAHKCYMLARCCW